MICTEEEAKTKWCPFTRVGNEAGCNRNGDDFFAAKPNCIGSACMAWQWSPKFGDGKSSGFCGLTRNQGA